VTGGNSGIGLALAKRFAIEGHDVLLAGEEEGMDAAVEAVRGMGARVETVVTDLRQFDGVHALVGKIKEMGRPVDAIAINAGFGAGGAFTDTDLHKELDMIDLNVKSSVHLAKHVLRDMKARNKGRVLFTSSVAAVMPSPFEAVYGATKAFLLVFSESLANEMKDSDVTVTAILPGPTETNFFHRADMDDTKAGQDPKDDVDEVAKRAYEAMVAGKEKAYVGSFKNRMMGMMADLFPDDFGAEAHRKLSEPGSGNSGASIR
jgi:short-subunit dehydrogenase